MKLQHINQIFFNKKTSLNLLLEYAVSFSDLLNLPNDRFYFYLDEFDVSKRSPIDTLIKRYPEIEQFAYEYKRFPNDKKNTRAISNVPDYWKENNISVNQEYIEIKIIEEILKGIPRSYSPFHFKILFTQQIEKMNINEKQLHFPRLNNNNSVAMSSDWNTSGRINSLSIRQTSDQFDIFKCDKFPIDLGNIPEKINDLKNAKKFTKNEIITNDNDAEIEEIIVESMNILKMNKDKISIPNKPDPTDTITNYTISYKEKLISKFKTIGFKYITKESRKDYYTFRTNTKNNNTLEIIVLINPHSRMIEFKLTLINFIMNVPLIGTDTLFLNKMEEMIVVPRLNGGSENETIKSIDIIYDIVSYFLNEITPKIDELVGKTPKWFT